MDSHTNALICAAITWGVALLVGVLGGAALMVAASWTFLQAIFAGGVIFVAVGLVLSLTLCGKLQGPVEPGSINVPPPIAPPAPTVPSLPGAPTASAPAPAPAAAAPAPTATAEVADGGSKPEALEGPRGGAADDLKKIKGVGPKLEQLLHSMGFYHFDQVANWTAAEVAWVDENLEGFKGRVTRDHWVAQAKLLAAGGETDFSRKVDEGDVY